MTLWLTSIIQVLFCLIIHKKQHEAFKVEKCTQCGLDGFTKYPGSMLQSITHVQDEMCESSSRRCCCNLSKNHHNHQESLATGIISNFSMKFHFCTSSSLELVKDSNISSYKVFIFCTCSILRAAWPSLPSTDWEQELSWYISTTLCSTRIWDTNFDNPKHEKHPHKITRSSELIFILLEIGSKYADSIQALHSSSILCAWVMKMSKQSLMNNTARHFASINCWFSLEHARRFLNVNVHSVGQNKFNLWILLHYLQMSEARILNKDIILYWTKKMQTFEIKIKNLYTLHLRHSIANLSVFNFPIVATFSLILLFSPTQYPTFELCSFTKVSKFSSNCSNIIFMVKRTKVCLVNIVFFNELFYKCLETFLS